MASSAESSSPPSSFLSTAWDAFNAPDSFLPMYFSLAVFVALFAYTKRKGLVFHQCDGLHNFHHFVQMFLGSISIYFANDAIFNERVCNQWSIGYFFVDLVDTSLRRDSAYFIHASLSLGITTYNWFSPVAQVVRVSSKGSFCNLSTPLLQLSRTTRNPMHFVLFGLMFTLCRVMLIPYIINQVLQQPGVTFQDPWVICMSAFYLLNVFWYYKILRIIANYAMIGNSRPAAEDEKKKNV